MNVNIRATQLTSSKATLRHSMELSRATTKIMLEAAREKPSATYTESSVRLSDFSSGTQVLKTVV
jgi:hypothetical protein